ncbi:MAG: NfeD family protein [Planctomycetes bacterium]|nr:NfeD family protein [Planctomycetota bacterium]
MGDWWQGLTTAHKVFVFLAAFSSVLFLWQMIGAVMGLGGGEDFDTDGGDADVAGHGDVDVDSDVHADAHAGHGGDEGPAGTVFAFKLLSLRSIIAFVTLFSWGGTLYLSQDGMTLEKALAYSVLWGLAAMLIVALLIYKIAQLQETGNKSLATAVGQDGTVYADIPENGAGKVRVLVSGVISFVNARCKDGAAAKAGTEIKVLRVAGPNILEVEQKGMSEGEE